MSGTARRGSGGATAARGAHDPWRAAFVVLETLKARLGAPAWLRGFRVQTSRTGEVEIEVEALAGRPRTFLPDRIDRVPVRVRELPASNEPHAEPAVALP